ncbi:STAS/SEC14 domain-containing protein [Christiangramia sediminis]|uniref:STAS/SEC14 domain-containing protein n=1 Tax=Christiangramia sediminis TaxID=2881336 RepID=A0A9X1LJP7_9FLAO|nr:STAS/SEC14 domain-containing protein [Christiangramia sediminis]MCB7481569.1 STAS/SEC14 domain-containing protein [Christiangramia sediminis]
MISTFEFADHVVGFLVNDDIDKELIEKIHEAIDSKLRKHEMVNLFVEITEGNQFSFSALMKDIVFKTKHSGQFGKIAIVTNLEWFKAYASMKDVFMDADVRSFSNNDRLEAINWISQ